MPLCVLALIAVGGAQASKIPFSSFGSTGTLGGQFSATTGIGGVAVSSTGDVYAVDRGNNRVQQFHPNGDFVRAFGANVGGVGVNVCTVAPSCQAGTASNAAGGLSAPQGIAIDQANDNVFVTDQGNRRVDVFGEDGTFQGAFGWGVDTGVAAFQFCTIAVSCQAPNTTTPTGGEAGKFGTQIGYPAVDPSSGNLYVADPINRRVDQFGFTLNGSEEVTNASFVNAFGWGVDTGVAAFEVCTVASTCGPSNAIGGANVGQFGLAGPSRVAVDSSGAVYTVESLTNFRVQKFTPQTGPPAFSPALFGVADFPNGTAATSAPTDVVIGTGDHVFIAKAFPAGATNPCPTGAASLAERRVLEMSADGSTLTDTHMACAAINSVNGIALDPASGRIYVSSTTEGQRVYVLADPHPPVATTGASSPGFDDHLRTLNGTVNPAELKVAACRFEYGPTTQYGQSTPCVPAAATIGNGISDIAVSAETEPLEPNTIYHYRLTASNLGATGKGEDRTFTTGPAPADDCSNAAIRAEQGIGTILLPGCMALEMVSPPQKGGQLAKGPAISADGERVIFRSLAALGGTPGVLHFTGDLYVASRGPSGWTTDSTAPPAEVARVPDDRIANFSPDFSSWFQIAATGPQYQIGVSQIFQANLDGSRIPVSPLLSSAVGTDEGVATRSRLQGASADLSHVYLEPGRSGNDQVQISLLPGDPEPKGTGADNSIYVARLDSSGAPVLELLARDRDGKVWGGRCGARLGGVGPTTGGFPAKNGERNQGAVSPDGTRVYFSARAAQPQSGECSASSKLRILERLESSNGIHIKELFGSECNRADCSTQDGDDLYQGASTDGTKVYFTTNRQLADADLDESEAGKECSIEAAEEGCDLYLYDSTQPAGQRLIQVSTGGPTPGEGAKVFNGITAISGDGSHAYFVAEGILSADANPEGKKADEYPATTPKLYLYERDSDFPIGHTSFLGALDPGDQADVTGGSLGLWGTAGGTFRNQAYPVPVLGKNDEDTEVGGEGDVLFFESKAALTADDSDAGHLDVYRYDAGADPPTLERVSKASPGGSDNGAFDVTVHVLLGPAGPSFAEDSRWASEDGQTALLETAEGLMPGDVNGAMDIYLWRDGELFRLPGKPFAPVGSKEQDPVLSHDGSQVAFPATSPLLPADGDTVPDIYVVRASGGFPNPAEPAPCDPLVEASCQGAAGVPSGGPSPGSAGATSPGNVKPRAQQCPKGKRKVRRKGKVRCAKPHKQRSPRRHAKGHHTRHANADRRAGK